MLGWLPPLILSLFVAKWPPSPSFTEFTLVIVLLNLGPSSPLLFPVPVVRVRQFPHIISVWGCLMSAYLGIMNHSFLPSPESGTPFPSPFFLTPLILTYLRGGSASIFAAFFDHWIMCFFLPPLFLGVFIYLLFILYFYFLFIFLSIYLRSGMRMGGMPVLFLPTIKKRKKRMYACILVEAKITFSWPWLWKEGFFAFS